nr:hypothetical protein [Spirochaetaceae bacterium]
MIKSKLFIISAIAAVFSLIAVITLLGFKISSLSDKLNENHLMYNRELDNSKILIDEITQNLQIISSSNNDVRKSLNLPTRQLIQNNSEDGDTEQINGAVTFFDAFQYLINNEDLERTAAEFTRFIENNDLEEYFTDGGYIFKRENFHNVSVMKNNAVYISINFDSENNKVIISDTIGNNFDLSLIESEIISKLDKEMMILSHFDDVVRDLNSSLEQIIVDEEVKAILVEREILIKKTDSKQFNIINTKDYSIIG